MSIACLMRRNGIFERHFRDKRLKCAAQGNGDAEEVLSRIIEGKYHKDIANLHLNIIQGCKIIIT